MNKQDAIRIISKVQAGEFKKPSVEDMPTGSIARTSWRDDMFSYGMEYGIIYGLMVAFDIGKDEL